MPNLVLGLDLSFSRASAGWWVQRKAEGFQVMSQCLDTGGVNVNPGLIPIAEENLMNALAAGFKIAGYVNASPYASGAKAIQKAQTTAGQAWAHLPVLFVDIEIDGVTQTRIHETCEAAKATGKAVAVYSARWFWQKLGNPQWPWLLEYGLWVADYDGDPNVATSALFGPWAQATHKQYTNTTDVGGVSIDYDTFDLSLWQGDDDMTPEEKRQLDTATADIAAVRKHLDTLTGDFQGHAATEPLQQEHLNELTGQFQAHTAQPHSGGPSAAELAALAKRLDAIAKAAAGDG